MTLFTYTESGVPFTLNIDRIAYFVDRGDVINLHIDQVMFTVRGDDAERLRGLLGTSSRGEADAPVAVKRGRAAVKRGAR